MRLRPRVALAIAALLAGQAAAAGEAPTPAPEEVTVQDALDEPSDPDDAADIRADDDPADVGERGLDPARGGSPKGDGAPSSDAAHPDADRCGE